MYFAIVSVDRDINTATNILRVGQIDCHGEEIKSQATGDLELKIPVALQKMTDKIERSGICLLVSHGSGQAVRSLVMQQLTIKPFNRICSYKCRVS